MSNVFTIGTEARPFSSRSLQELEGIIASTSSPRIARAMAEIDRTRSLRPGWDGYSGCAPSAEAVEQAKAFIASIPATTTLPEIEVSGDGIIDLVWRSASAYLEIGFTGDREFSFLGKSLVDPTYRVFGDVPVNANRLPMPLTALLGLFLDAELRLREENSERGSLAWAS